MSNVRLISLSTTNANRLNGDYLSRVDFQFRNLLRNEEDILYSTVTIQSAELPFSIYNVAESTNIVKYQVSGVPYTLTVPEGNYNMRTFQTVFQTLFANGGHGKTCVLGIDSVTGKYTLNPGDATADITILYTGTTAFRQLGLAPNTDQTFTHSILTPQSFPYPANFLGVTKLKLYSNALASFNSDSEFMTESSLVETIPVNAPSFGLIQYSNTGENEYVLRSSVVNVIDMELRDEFHNLVDFNNQDWTLSLIIKSYRQEADEPMTTATFSDMMDLQRRSEIIKALKADFTPKEAPVLKKLSQLEDFEENDDLSDLEDDNLELLLGEEDNMSV